MTIEEYFKDKINWKFFNKILDKMTIFEDNGIVILMEIMIGTITINEKGYSGHYICSYSSKDAYIDWSNENFLKNINYDCFLYKITSTNNFAIEKIKEILINTNNFKVITSTYFNIVIIEK